ncbi:short integuments 2, mitochondrial-like [Quercus robur]|uniref:short integuments 2, mitochondrial-like n=1 Tax=Quercus robur TaxID=38942 RepID=UPI002162DF63|nr:short integuments 2, mitochondrial-like [Quercus robur]
MLIAGYKIAHQPSIYVLDIPGVLVPSIPDIETELKLVLAGLNTQGTPLHWKHLNNKRLEGIQYDSKEKHEYDLKDLQPKRRKLPNDSDMLCIELLELVELKLKEVISREPTLLVLVVHVPNIGKSSLINAIHQIVSFCFPGEDEATLSPLPGVTQDIVGYKIVHQPSIYVLNTLGVLVPSIPDIETGL